MRELSTMPRRGPARVGPGSRPRAIRAGVPIMAPSTDWPPNRWTKRANTFGRVRTRGSAYVDWSPATHLPADRYVRRSARAVPTHLRNLAEVERILNGAARRILSEELEQGMLRLRGERGPLSEQFDRDAARPTTGTYDGLVHGGADQRATLGEG
jgi:hypothetical protein